MNEYIYKEIASDCIHRNNLLNVLQSNQKSYYQIKKYIDYKPYRFNAVYCYTWRAVLFLSFLILGVFLVKIENDYNKILISPNSEMFELQETYFKFQPLISVLIPIMFICSIVFLALLMSKIMGVAYRKHKIVKLKDDLLSIENDIQSLKNRLNGISCKIQSYDLLPVAYWYAGDRIMQYLINKRADNIKEAINLFEFERRQDIQFNKQMEALQNINGQLVRNGILNTAGMVVMTGAITSAIRNK